MSVQFAGQCPWAVSGKVWQKIRAVVALRAADTLGGSQAVSMALDVRQHGSKTPCRWLWWNGIYNFSAPYICHYFEMNGIDIPTEEGAKHRLPFILNLLYSINIIQFKGASSFIIQRLPLSRSLFEGTNLSHSPDELLNAVKQFYMSNIPVEQEICSELKQLFGKDFLTDAYKIKP